MVFVAGEKRFDDAEDVNDGDFDIQGGIGVESAG